MTEKTVKASEVRTGDYIATGPKRFSLVLNTRSRFGLVTLEIPGGNTTLQETAKIKIRRGVRVEDLDKPGIVYTSERKGR